METNLDWPAGQRVRWLLRAAHAGIAAICLGGVVSAQNVFIVDANGGPGAHFTDLGAATAAVPDGAVLLVRPGSYAAHVTIAAKSLTVLADPGAKLEAVPGSGVIDFTVTGLASAQQVVVRGLSFECFAFALARLFVTNCAGEVVLANLRPTAANTGGSSLDASNCASLHVRDSRFGATRLANCETTITACALPVVSPLGHGAGTIATGGRLTLVDSQLSGVMGSQPVANAVTLNGAELRALGNCSLTGAGGFGPGHAIGGSGSARVEPTVTLASAPLPPVAPGVSLALLWLARAVCTDPPLGGVVTTSLYGPAGHYGFLFVSAPALPFPAPSFPEPIWLDPTTAVLQQHGVTSSTAPILATTSIPAVPSLSGAILHWQGLVWHPVSGWQGSNPAVYAAH